MLYLLDVAQRTVSFKASGVKLSVRNLQAFEGRIGHQFAKP